MRNDKLIVAITGAAGNLGSILAQSMFANLLDCAIEAGVKRMVLISFPHVEGETSLAHPATGRLNGKPVSIHAATRLEEEKLLMTQSGMEKVILRCGMIYGRGILMIDAAHWFSRYYLLGVWRKPNFIG